MVTDKDFPAQRVSILKIPVDILPEDKVEEAIKFLADDGGPHQIVLLSLWDLMRARHNHEYRVMVNNASLVLPISRSLVKAAHFLRRPVPDRYMPFDFFIKTLGVLEQYGKTAYLIGSKKKNLQGAERNLKSTFPGLRIVGRFSGFYPKAMEPKIIEAVRKSTPTLLMVGRGVPGRERWIGRNRKNFTSGIVVWCDDVFDIFSDRKHRVSRSVFQKGFEWIPYTLQKPWKAARIFVYFWFKALLLVYRLRRI